MGVDGEMVREAARAVRRAEAMLIGAGAGMGVDSGLPDFRGPKGFWRAYPPYAERGLGFIDLADPSWFTRDPALAWGFYGHRLGLYRRTTPHAGFGVLRRWAAGMAAGSFVFTSNVDGQFQRAGFSPEGVVECHGSIHHLQCHEPCRAIIWDASELEVVVDERTFTALPPLPRCPSCGSLARPNILMFGDWSWIHERTAAQEARLDGWIAALGDRAAVVVECGAGLQVPTVRWRCEQVAARLGAPLIRINPREAQGPTGTITIEAGALESLEAIDAAVVAGAAGGRPAS